MEGGERMGESEGGRERGREGGGRKTGGGRERGGGRKGQKVKITFSICKSTYTESEVVLMLAVNRVSEVLRRAFGKFTFLVQQVNDTNRLLFYQI